MIRSRPRVHETCNPDTDANNLVSPNPNSPDHVGKHPDNAFMELQFYGPGVQVGSMTASIANGFGHTQPPAPAAPVGVAAVVDGA